MPWKQCPCEQHQRQHNSRIGSFDGARSLPLSLLVADHDKLEICVACCLNHIRCDHAEATENYNRVDVLGYVLLGIALITQSNENIYSLECQQAGFLPAQQLPCCPPITITCTVNVDRIETIVSIRPLYGLTE